MPHTILQIQGLNSCVSRISLLLLLSKLNDLSILLKSHNFVYSLDDCIRLWVVGCGLWVVGCELWLVVGLALVA
jgi:hypothetical protein